MVAYAVSHHLNEDGLAAVEEGEAARFFCGASDREDVVAVDAEGCDAQTCSAGSDAIATVLVGGGRRDGIAIIAADKYARDLTRCGDVEGGVEIAFAGCSFAEIADYDALGLVRVVHVLQLECVGGTGCVGYLGCERGADSVDVEFLTAVVDGGVAAATIVFGVGEELVHEGGQREAALQVDARFAVLAECYVAGLQGGCRADGDAFFAC